MEERELRSEQLSEDGFSATALPLNILNHRRTVGRFLRAKMQGEGTVLIDLCYGSYGIGTTKKHTPEGENATVMTKE